MSGSALTVGSSIHFFLNCVRFLVVLLQQILAKILGEVAIHAVDMIGVVLRVVVFDQERRPLNAIVMPLAALQSAGPGEVNVFLPGIGDPLQVDFRDLAACPLYIDLH